MTITSGRDGLRRILEAEDDFAVVAEAADADAALREVLAHRPSVLLLDLNMPGETTSLAAIPHLSELSPRTAVVILTIEEDPLSARRALRAGASGYVLKDSANTELMDAVRAAAAGQPYVVPRLGAALAALSASTAQRDGALASREAEVLQLLALGHTNPEIADRLCVSVRTVESHRTHLKRKLRRSTRAELVRYALDHDPPPS
jgi:two-component system response regulator NreC